MGLVVHRTIMVLVAHKVAARAPQALAVGEFPVYAAAKVSNLYHRNRPYRHRLRRDQVGRHLTNEIRNSFE